ncbi:hypothetical protein J437_LFUL002668 [Ladona fulva]|uniref:NUP160 helical domain-containing protein n=1 Tax=Ladona fulva TaxID=123851 RepID=A0A8K0NWG2_LADFU|nr:hypothetical protein J437_LFUL002668 [Ladona fulva]
MEEHANKEFVTTGMLQQWAMAGAFQFLSNNLNFQASLLWANKFKNPSVCLDMCKVIGALNILEKRLPDGLKAAFERDLHRLRSPDSAMADLAHTLLSDSTGENLLDPCAPDSFWKCLEQVKNMYGAMLMLLKALTLDHDQPNELILEEPGK